MHIKHIHETIEKLSQYACEEACKNKESINTEELGDVIDMIKDLACAEKDARISKAMEEAEKEDEEEAKYIMKKMKEEYGEEEGERRFYDNYRYKSSGRFAPKGRGSYMPVRGYDEMPYMMMPQVHNPMEYMRDFDKEQGRMYFSGNASSGSTSSMSGTRGYSDGFSDGQSRGYSEGYERGRNEGKRNESRSERARRNYAETKEMNKGNTPEEKQKKMKELETYTKELAEDVTAMIADASPEERSLLKQKMQVLMQKI